MTYRATSGRGNGCLTYLWPVILLALLALLEVGAGHLTSRQAAVQAARAQGFTHVRVTSTHYAFVELQGCGGADAAKYSMTGVNPAGRRVSFYVCAGWPFKGDTIRY